MKSTLEQLESLEEIVQFSSWPEVRKKLEVVLKRLESYEVGKYSDWRNKVSDILDQNLGKHLIRREEASDREEGEEESKVGRFVVNFTSDLSDTFAEVPLISCQYQVRIRMTVCSGDKHGEDWLQGSRGGKEYVDAGGKTA